MKIEFANFDFLHREVDEIKEYVKREHSRFLEKTVIREARNFAANNLPGGNDESIEPFLTSIRAFYDNLRNEVSIWLQGGVQHTIGSINLATVSQSMDCAQKSLEDEAQVHRRLTADRGRMHLDGDHASYKRQRALLLAIGLSDCIWTISGFIRLGDIVLIAMCVGTGIGIAQTVAVKTAVQIIKEETDKAKRRLYLILMAVGAAVLSVVLSLIRYWFIHTGSGASVPLFILNPLTFTAINLVFVAATALLVYFHYPSKTEIKEMRKAEALDTELGKSKERQAVLAQDIEKLRKERDFIMEFRTRLAHAERKLHDLVGGKYDEAVGHFKHENSVKRTDQVFPDCFKRPHRPLGDTQIEHVELLSH